MNPLLMSLLLVAALSFFGYTMSRKIGLLMALKPANRFKQLGERFRQMILIAVGQKRLIGRKKEWLPGLMHALIFWGFCILLIRSVSLYGEGFARGFQLPFLGENHLAGYLYLALKDIMEGIVLIMVLFAFFRRVVLKPDRLHNSWEAYLVLGMIGLLMISDLLYDGTRYNLINLYNNPGNIHFFSHSHFGSEFLWTPVTVGAAAIISRIGVDATQLLMTSMFWLHIITQLVFLNSLPYGKHFHVITALPNVFFKSLSYPHEKIGLLDLENENAWEDESLGLNHIHQLNWKQGLDLYTCTECGRCKEVCPAYITEKPLNLHDFNDKLKAELWENANNIIQRSKLSTTIQPGDTAERCDEIKAKMVELNSNKQLIIDVISEDSLWSCTTCRACEEVCPVTIEHVPRIVAMRQGQVLMQEAYPKELSSAFKGLERNGNPWGIGYDKRADWAEGLNVKKMADDSDVEYLFWVGCSGSFDDRTKKVSTCLVDILQKANVSFAILGIEEKCTGDFARRVGNEMLYQMMAQENIETLNKYQVKKIVTICPHCLNTLKQDYPQLGGHYEVIHHVELIDQLIKTKKITLSNSFNGSLTYHDPCYLGRYHSIYNQPRTILQSISKSGFREMERSKQESFCCGAGGGRMWMEENIGKRINLERAGEILNHRVESVAVGCPFCLTMLEDGLKELGKAEEINTLDIAELVAKNMV